MPDETVTDVGIALGEGGGGVGGGAAEDEESAVGGFGERSGEEEFAPEMGLAGEEEVLVAKGSAASDEVADYFIEESEIGHSVSLTRNRVSRWGGGRGDWRSQERVIGDQISAIRKREKAYAEDTENAEITEQTRKSRSLHCAARRARILHGRKSRAAPVGMTSLSRSGGRGGKEEPKSTVRSYCATGRQR